MENNKLFKSFDYVVRNLFVFEDKVEVRVFFIYKEFYAMNKSLFIKKLKNKDEAYYLDEAKRIINEMIVDGSLKQECEKKIKRKKLLPILIPISAMAIAGITVGCIFGLNGNGGVTPIVYHTIKFSDNSLNCKMYDVVEPYGEVTSKEWEAGEIARYKIKENYACSLPSEDQITFTTDDGQAFDGLHSYDASTGELSVKMTANVTITAKADYYWYLDNDNFLSKLTEEDVTKVNEDGTIGVVQTLKVNGVDHQVRLIGVDEDYGTIGDESTKIHTTWEFVNLLSDENGYSLAAYWNDTATLGSVNHNYMDSTIRAVLNGNNYEGSSTADINWFRYYGQPGGNEDPRNYEFAQEERYQKSALDMLPDGLVNVLKAPSKYINISTDAYPYWEERTVKDKLFLLSPKEMGNVDFIEFEEPSTAAYSYYNNLESWDRKIKKQVAGDVGARTTELSGVTSGDAPGNKSSCAGYNDIRNIKYGGRAWTRSPQADPDQHGDDDSAWEVTYMGKNSFMFALNHAYGIAPAFCI